MFDAAKVRTMIPKRFKGFIEGVEEDSEVVEVLLKDGFINADAETIWVFAKERYELSEYNLKQIKEDLMWWLRSVEATKE
jgi:hypothetical protein